jgi:hypothetical protein
METTCEPGSFSFGVDCFACLNEDWCLGNTTCAEGHLGYMCSQCGRFLCSLPLSLMSCFFIHRSLPLSLSLHKRRRLFHGRDQAAPLRCVPIALRRLLHVRLTRDNHAHGAGLRKMNDEVCYDDPLALTLLLPSHGGDQSLFRSLSPLRCTANPPIRTT